MQADLTLFSSIQCQHRDPPPSACDQNKFFMSIFSQQKKALITILKFHCVNFSYISSPKKKLYIKSFYISRKQFPLTESLIFWKMNFSVIYESYESFEKKTAVHSDSVPGSTEKTNSRRQCRRLASWLAHRRHGQQRIIIKIETFLKVINTIVCLLLPFDRRQPEWRTAANNWKLWKKKRHTYKYRKKNLSILLCYVHSSW